MSAADSREGSAPAASLAATCREAGFVTVAATADGDALAALGVLVGGLRAVDTPFQASVAPLPDPAGTEADATVTLGTAGGDAALVEGALAPVAYAAARDLGADPDPTLAIAGAIAAGAAPEDAAVPGDERPDRAAGVAVPTVGSDPGAAFGADGGADALADGLAHSMLVHAPAISGDPAAAREALEGLDGPTPRAVASFVACAAVEAAPPRAAAAVERALRPYVGGPFGTLGGYADVLDAVARRRPGTGVALALDGRGAAADAALAAWRETGRETHRAVRAAEPARHDGCLVARIGGPEGASEVDADRGPGADVAGIVARLLWAYRSPEPVVAVLADGAGAVHGPGAGDALRAAATATGAAATARPLAADAGGRTPETGVARGIDDPDAFVRALRGAL